ncbi:MAG TPA: hypothetical protein PKD83_05340 [Ignavibacteria bacterium]|nr:hypothetical protein [Ignavibacteria bacterium]
MKIIISILIIVLITNFHLISVAFSQTDSGKTFYTKKFSISYSGFYNMYLKESKDILRFPEIKTIDNINKFRFYEDSLIKISNTENLKVHLKLSDIQEVSFVKGKSTGKGIWIGALAGTVIGFVAGMAIGDDGGMISSSEVNALAGAIIFAPICALIGGIIGGNANSYNNYDFTDIKLNKKEELIKILNLNHSIKKSNDLENKNLLIDNSSDK